MALNFPSTPADGDTYEGYVYDASDGVWNSDPHQIASRFVTSATAPSDPSEGDGWFDTNTAKSYTYYDGVWVQLGALGTVDINQIADVNVSSPANGESLVYDGTEWVNEQLQDTYTFSELTDTVITTPQIGDSLVYNGTDWVNRPEPGRNLLYNGAMQVHQRGTSATGLTGTTGYYTADRWQFNSFNNATNIGTWTQTIENDAPAGSGFRKSLKLLCTTAKNPLDASSTLIIRQEIEGQNLQEFRKGTAEARDFVLSFWVKSNVVGTHVARIVDRTNGRHVSAQYTIFSSGVWENKVVVFPEDSVGEFAFTNASGGFVAFGLAAGSDSTSGTTLQTAWGPPVTQNLNVGQANVAAATNNYWQITGIQLEIGPVATPFEFKPYGQELAECQRYYQRHTPGGAFAYYGTGNAFTTSAINLVVFLKNTMRVPPTSIDIASLSLYAVETGATGVTSPTSIILKADSTTSDVLALQFTKTTSFTVGANYTFYSNNTTSSYLGISAEL